MSILHRYYVIFTKSKDVTKFIQLMWQTTEVLGLNHTLAASQGLHSFPSGTLPPVILGTNSRTPAMSQAPFCSTVTASL